MATLAKGYTFGATESVTNAKLHALVDSATITGIVNADIAVGAAIAFSKIAQANIDGALLTGLANIVSGAGVIPAANLTSVAQKGANTDITSLGGLTTPLDETMGGTGQTTITQGDILYGSAANTLSKLAAGTSGQYLKTQGAGANPVWGDAGTRQLFTSSGTFTAPAGITQVYITAIGGGGGGGGGGAQASESGGGGGSGASITKYPYTVIAENEYTVTINSGGGGGAAGLNGEAGTAGGDVVFDSLTINGGSGGYGGRDAAGAGGAGGAKSSGMASNGPGFSQDGGAGVINLGGYGGNSLFGTGGIGGTGANGGAGSGYGAGGGGAGQGAYNGGDGAAGFVLVEW